MADTTTSPPVGTDGGTPIYNPNERWCWWALADLWMGQAGTNKYVPKVNDYVKDYTTDTDYIVLSLDATTLVPTLEKVIEVKDPGDMTIDVLLGPQVGTQSDTYRINIDAATIPATVAIDQRCYINGSMAKYCKIFKGSNLDGTAVVISGFYDQSGNLLGENVPLELVSMPNGQNYATYVPMVCYTTYKITDGEILTVVFYSDTGSVVSTRQCLAWNTAFIRDTDASKKYVTSVNLETPFLSDADPKVIQYPLNMPLNGLNLIGVVNYSDGTKRKMPVDGTKFQIQGLQSVYLATIIGQELPLVLTYYLSQNETAYTGNNVGNGPFIAENYKAITVKSDGSYNVKLYGYPVWIDATNGYRLKWYLYHLDRQTFEDATPYVVIDPNGPSFNPIGYGITQNLRVSVNLQSVNGTYKSYIHAQTIAVVLNTRADDRSGTNWSIGFDPGQNPLFGVGNHANVTFVNQNLKYVDISLGETDQAVWLNRLYWATKPLTDPATELAAPTPNMFALYDGTYSTEYTISNWANTSLQFAYNVPDNGTLFVKFFYRTNESDLQLSMSALPIWQVTS